MTICILIIYIVIVVFPVFGTGIVWRIYKDAIFDTNRKSLLRHTSAEKGIK